MRSLLVPLDCDEVRKSLEAHIGGSLDAARRGRLAGHLDCCDECAIAYSQIVAEWMAAGMLPIPGSVRKSPGTKWAIAGRDLLVWGREIVEHAALVALGYPGALQAVQGAGIMLGSAGGETISFGVLNADLSPLEGSRVAAEVVGAPLVERDGGFSMTVWIEEDAVERYLGLKAICVLKLDTVWLGFESVVRTRQIEFRGDGLPTLAETDCLLDAGALEYFLVSDPIPDGN